MTDNIFSFNLVDEKWLPCIRAADGTAVTLSLRETFAQAHELYDLAGETPVHSGCALYRLLIAILLRVYQPSIYDEDIWADMWHSPTWDMTRLNAYLDEQKPRFDLFGEHPSTIKAIAMTAACAPSPSSALIIGNGFLHNPLFDDDTKADSQTPPPPKRRVTSSPQTFGLGGGHKGMFTDVAVERYSLLCPRPYAQRDPLTYFPILTLTETSSRMIRN